MKVLRRIVNNDPGCDNPRCWNVMPNEGDEPGYHLRDEEWEYALDLLIDKFGIEPLVIKVVQDGDGE